MKKILSLLLAILMLVALVSCVKKTDGEQGTESTTTVATTAKPELSRGKIEGDAYKNNYLGFEFTKPDSWVYSTDEEIAQMLNLTVDNILGDKFKEALENNPAIYDMMVVDSVTRTNINVVYENLKKSFASNITEEQYVDALKQQMAGVSGMTVTFPDKLETAKLGETEFKKCVCTTVSGGVTMTQVYYLRNVDGYMACVIVTIVKGYTVADIEAMFK